jgi:signal transduction histidine kinase
VVGNDLSGETPAQSVQIPGLPFDGRPVDLVLQVSNHHYREGGVVSSIELGSAKQLESAQVMQWGLTLFCIGSLLVMGLYHVVLYCFRRKNTAPLYFGFYCLLWTGYLLTSTSNDWVVNLLFDRIPIPLLNRVDLLCFVISVPVGYAFFRTLYPEEFSMRLQKATWAMAVVFTFAGLALPTMTFTSIIPAYYLFSIMMIFYCLVWLFAAMRRKRQGALFILLGCLALGSAGLNDMLYDMQLIRSVYLTHLGMFVFILFQAFALSLRFARAFTAVEWLSDELADKNLSLEKEMAERTRLEREIVNVSEEERRSISHDLHDGLCQLLTGARLHFSALRRKLAGAEDQPPEWRQLSSLLEESVNLAYDLSRGLWPVDHDPHGITPSLEELTHRLSESSGIAVEFRQRCGCPVCSNAGMTQLFRIAQEAITNAVRHARPGRIIVGFECADRKTITLTVRDDGIGRSNGSGTKGGLGLGIMAHRARIIGGGLTVSDREGGGTIVTCIAPCEVYSTEDSNG